MKQGWSNNLIDIRHPFFNPRWRRVAVTAVTTIWTVFELSNGQILWASLFAVLTAVCVYNFFFNWTDQPED